jgi:hypothetical protein
MVAITFPTLSRIVRTVAVRKKDNVTIFLDGRPSLNEIILSLKQIFPAKLYVAEATFSMTLLSV